jgi:hypothetical protein
MMEQRVIGHRLSEAFDQDNARHNGAIGEMAQKKGLVGLEGPDSNDPVLAELDDPIDEEKGRAMRKDRGNARERAGGFGHEDWVTIRRRR